MHQIGLIRVLRAAIVLSAALLAAAQLFAITASADARGDAALAAGADVLPDRIGAVGFDGAAPRAAVEDRRASLAR
jgi:hypothetical protein